MSLIMCISSFLECLIFGEKKLTAIAIKKIKCQILEVFLMMQDFLDMPKCCSDQLIIMYK